MGAHDDVKLQAGNRGFQGIPCTSGSMWYSYQRTRFATVLCAVLNIASECRVLRGACVEAQMSVGGFTDENWTGMIQ
jgi:hypothetical protein